MLVRFPGDGITLRGFLFRPLGPGPQPAIVWCHGSERTPGPARELAEFFTTHGYVFFAPHRRGHGESPGAYPLDAIAAGAARGHEDRDVVRATVIRAVIEMHERHLTDTARAIDWLRGRPFVDSGRTAMAGVSHGAIQTLLGAAADLGPAAYVSFSPGAMAWGENPELRDRLSRAAAAARAPVLLVQAENDYDLGPSKVLGPVITRRGAPSACRVYPPYGVSRDDGHGAFACGGMAVWGTDVLAFLRDAMAAGPPAPRQVA